MPPTLNCPTKTKTATQFIENHQLNIIRWVSLSLTSWSGGVQGAAGRGRVHVGHLGRIREQDLPRRNGLGMRARLSGNRAGRHDPCGLSGYNFSLNRTEPNRTNWVWTGQRVDSGEIALEWLLFMLFNGIYASATVSHVEHVFSGRDGDWKCGIENMELTMWNWQSL